MPRLTTTTAKGQTSNVHLNPPPAARAAAMAAAISAVALLAMAFVFRVDEGTPANAADGETAQLISYMNSYRAGHGAGPLSAGGQINADAQSIAQQVTDSGNYGAMYNTGYNTSFGSYGYPTASCLWNVWLSDPFLLEEYISDPKYNFVGVGRAFGEHYSPMWVILLDKDGQKSGAAAAATEGGTSPAAQPAGGSICPSEPASSPTPAPTQTLPPTNTATPGASQTTEPSTSTQASPTPTVSASTTETAPPTDTRTDSPSPTTVPDVGGDVDCSGGVDMFDGIEVLKVIGGAAAHAPCITASGPDCTGFLTANDALVLFLYLGGLPVDLPDGCPAIGSITTPTPGPSPTVTPTPTATPTPDGTPGPGAAMDHCWLAPVVYDITYHWLLDGDYTCTPDNGASYTCNFPSGSNAIECATDTGLDDYSCYVWSDAGIDVPCASSLTTGGDYLCHQGEASIICEADTSPTYICTVEDQLVTCTGPATFAWSPPAPE